MGSLVDLDIEVPVRSGTRHHAGVDGRKVLVVSSLLLVSSI
jgi:hypothetical protein